LTRRRALITGASRGIGAACARALSRDGFQVVLVSRTESDLKDLAAQLTSDSVFMTCDLSENGAGRWLGSKVLDEVGPIDVLVNNAGAGYEGRTSHLDPVKVNSIFTLNLLSAMELSGILAPKMPDDGTASIVNISSISGAMSVPFSAVYAATKAGLDGLTRSLAAEYGPSGIRVNSIAPGVIVTDAWTAGREIPNMIEILEDRTSLRRWGSADEVAAVVSFLVSTNASYITGQTLVVDGGLSLLLDPIPRKREMQR
jgi:NAD(P)-dependent dehydrogenase (short-subunit alcohol dehydrogenase family)